MMSIDHFLLDGKLMAAEKKNFCKGMWCMRVASRCRNESLRPESGSQVLKRHEILRLENHVSDFM